MEQIDTTIKDTQSGFTQSVDITAGVKAGPATMGAKTTASTSMNFGNSNVERTSKLAVKEGFRSSISNQARAKIFQIEMDGFVEPSPFFMNMFKNIKTEADAFNFVKFFGTHWIEKAQFGASFDKVIFIAVDKNHDEVEKFK